MPIGCVLVDEHGRLIDGDQLMAIIAGQLAQRSAAWPAAAWSPR